MITIMRRKRRTKHSKTTHRIQSLIWFSFSCTFAIIFTIRNLTGGGGGKFNNYQQQQENSSKDGDFSKLTTSSSSNRVSAKVDNTEHLKLQSGTAAIRTRTISSPPPQPLPSCTEQQLQIIRQQLPPDGCLANRNDCSLRIATRCPDPIWLQEYYFQSPPPQSSTTTTTTKKTMFSPFFTTTTTTRQRQQQQHQSSSSKPAQSEGGGGIGIYLGCNKGIDAIHTLRTLSYNKKYNPQRWRYVLDPTHLMKGGACNQALNRKTRQEINQLLFSNITRSRLQQVTQQEQYILQQQQQQHQQPAHVFCVEAMPGLATLLQTTAKTLQWEDVFHVINTAMSDTDDTTEFPDFLVALGFEAISIANCQTHPEDYNGTCHTIPQRRLDTLIETDIIPTILKDHKMNNKNNNDFFPIIDILSIDVEGYDFEVLMGSNETLYHTKYLEFEINNNGLWPQRKLETVITWLSEQYGFVCYWMGSGGHLWRITNCFQSLYYESKVWSNVACVNHNSHIWRQTQQQQQKDDNDVDVVIDIMQDPSSLPYRMEAQFHTTLAAGTTVGYQNISKDNTDGMQYCTKDCRKKYRRLKKTGM